MNSPSTLDFESLIRPIEGENPAGEDLRADPSPISSYYQIKDARAAARAFERSGDKSKADDAAAEWRKVRQLAPDVLATKAKDLEIAAWLTEALVREHGFAGLRDGFRLTKELIDGFWDNLHPMPDEDGIATRVAPLVGLNGGESEGTLAVPIALAPITDDGDRGPFGLWRYAKARELSRTEDAQAIEQALEHGAGTLEQFETTVRNSNPDVLRAIAGDIDESLQYFLEMTAVLDEKCGNDSPPSSSLRNTLEEAKQTMKHVLESVAGIVLDAPAEEAAPEEEAPAEGDTPAAAAAAPAARPDQINTRDDAFRILSKVADYFRDAEPHSPLSSMLYQAVRWGRMPLDQLIEELIPDSSARDHFGLMTGVRGRAGGDDLDDE